jgi:hypothetical protein
MSKKINVPPRPKWNAQQQLDYMLQAIAYVLSQRQMRARWPSRNGVVVAPDGTG